MTINLYICMTLLFAQSTVCFLFWYLTQFDNWVIINPKPRIEMLSECGLDSVNEGHCVRDTVEGQSSCTVIHIHSYSRGGDSREFSPFIIVPEWAAGVRAVQTPGLIIMSKLTCVIIVIVVVIIIITLSLPADALIWHWYIHLTTPLHLPVTVSTHSLFTQCLLHSIKSVWVIRIPLFFRSVFNHSVPLRQTEVFMYRVWIHCELEEIWWRQNTIYI